MAEAIFLQMQMNASNIKSPPQKEEFGIGFSKPNKMLNG